jgi:hypothetical protein
MNHNISNTGSTSPASPISSEELIQSIETLNKQMEMNFDTLLYNRKLFLLKAAYELGYYYFLTDDITLTRRYFTICIKYLDQVDPSSSLYFEKDQLEKLITIIENEPVFMNGELHNTLANDNNDVEMTDGTNVTQPTNFLFNLSHKENDFQSLFQKTQLDKSDKAIIEVILY